MKKMIALSILWLSLLTSCSTTSILVSSNPLNSQSAQQKPYVVLVSLDGFRADYLDWYAPPFLSKLKTQAASAPYMISTYPSKTFTNHLSIVTGLYAENHGIVNNVFYDPVRGKVFRASVPEFARDGSWFSGTPLWVAAEKQGMRSAVYFWPGGEAKIAGYYPTYYLHYDKKVSVDERVQQVKKWLELPPSERPHFLAVYFLDVDSAGHAYGPRSSEVKEAVLKLDRAMAQLSEILERTQLPVSLVIVSDHGMQELSAQKLVYLEDFISLDSIKAVGDGTHVHLYAQEGTPIDQVYRKLKKIKTQAFKVYQRSELPQKYHYSKNPRAGDLIVEAQDSFTVLRSRKLAVMEHGNHGYHPESPAMRAIFMAKGPQIGSHVEVKPFQNIEVYPFILKLLHLQQSGPMDAQGHALDGAFNLELAK